LYFLAFLKISNYIIIEKMSAAVKSAVVGPEHGSGAALRAEERSPDN
jgi:hypothetical protein